MKKFLFAPLFAAAGFLLAATAGPAMADPPLALEFPVNNGLTGTWTTLIKKGDMIDDEQVGNMEGLTGDDNGNFYVADRGLDDSGGDASTWEDTCQVWRMNSNTLINNLVGQITGICRPSGLTFGPDGDLYITTSVAGGIIYRLTPNAGDPTGAGATGDVYATGVPGANGVAFSGDNLYVTDGTQNRGRVWKITGAGAQCDPDPAAGGLVNCKELFRTQPQRNGEALGGNVLIAVHPDGVGSVRYTTPPHNRLAPSASGRQDIVSNGIAFGADGETVFVSDTARGAIWVADLNNGGELQGPQQNCDKTFHKNVLCMSNLYVAHPLLEGVDGIALLDDGTIIASTNERNAIVAVLPDKTVVDLFRNAVRNSDKLRNGDGSNERPLESPSSPFISGSTFCTTNTEFNRRDNEPRINPNGHKVNCLLNFELDPSGLSLPR